MSSSEMTCSTTSSELSALLDDELLPERAAAVRAHVAGCSRCRADLQALESVRRALRTGVAGDVPDLVVPIITRIEQERAGGARRSEWKARAKIAAVAAAAAAVVLAGAWLPGPDDPPEAALASVVAEELRAHARALDAYRATFAITERGWHPEVGVRTFSAEVEFEAPQSFRLTISDETDYPGGTWPSNDVKLVANPRAWWIREPTSCSVASLPGCGGIAIDMQQRALTERQPFDGTIGLPTDIVLPVQTLADSPDFSVSDGGTISGRPALHVSLPYRQALPLVASLQAGGSWRTFYPSDLVDLWIDEATGFPLRFEIRASTSAERRIWAARHDYDDPPGGLLLEVAATDFSEPQSFAPGTFDPPQRGTVSSARFERSSWGGGWMEPDVTRGLGPFVAGRTEAGQRLLSYSEGMTWLKVLGSRDAAGTAPDIGSEEIRLPGDRWAYYEPATWRRGRTLEMFDNESSVLVETNLTRADLIAISSSIDFAGERLSGSRSGAVGTRRVDEAELEALGFVDLPSYLPEGYGLSGAFTSRTPTGIVTATAYYRGNEIEYDGLGIRITQSRGVDLLPPSPDAAVELEVAGQTVRWFPRRGEIDWIDQGVYRAISAPSLPRAQTLRIVAGLG